MLNITLLSLSVSTISSISPFLTFYHSYQGKHDLMLLNSRFSHSLNSVLYSSTSHHHSVLKYNEFNHMLNGAIKLTSNDAEVNHKNTIIKNKNFEERILFNDETKSGDLTIASCTFKNCNAEYGGAIFVEQDCSVILHDLLFDNCTATDGAGGYICKRRNERSHENSEIADEYLKQVDVQYCCFQNCRVICNKDSNTGYGGALIIAGNTVKLFYASTVNKEKPQVFANGAQFDIQSTDVSSQNVNATGGFSRYCGSIEYRKATTGFFRFQTIMHNDCMFVTAFSRFSSTTIDISYCNLIQNIIHKNENVGKPALVHVREQDINIKDFAFIDNTFQDDGRIASKEMNKPATINLIRCYANNYDIKDHEEFSTDSCEFKKTDATLNEILQLDLGECKGNVPPSELVITAVFTPSSNFSGSNVFSESNKFIQSNSFTKSEVFTKFTESTKSDAFSQSNMFSKSSEFSQSNMFSKSGEFSQSNGATPTVNERDLSDSSNKLKPSAIVGIAIGVVAAVAIVLLAAFFIIKKHKLNMIEHEDLETLDSDQSTTNTENPIYNKKAEDDPFKEDFV